MSNDDLGDRMKLYEGIEASRKFIPLLPVIARIDGRAFHSFTRGMERPFDTRLREAMVNTALWLVKHTGAKLGYTQSDEITLVWQQSSFDEQLWFGGRISKMTSHLAAQATLEFNLQIQKLMPAYAYRRPTFDARVWQLPNQEEAANAVIWREQDCVKNSVTMAAQCYYSHKALMGKSDSDRQEMLWQKGMNWNDYPVEFKRGVYIRRQKTREPFTTEELADLPPKHNARVNPDLIVERSRVQVMTLPVFSKIKNRTDVIFRGADPIIGGKHEAS